MSHTLVQTVSGGSGGYVNSFTIAITPSAHSLLILNLTAGTADTLSTVTDGNGNTWVAGPNSNNTTAGARQSWEYHVINSNAGATTITVTYIGGDFPDTAYILREYSGIATSSALDKTSTANDTNNFVQIHPAGTTAATTQAAELVVLGGGCAVGSDPVCVAGSGFSNGLEQKGFDTFTYAFMSDKTVAAMGTQTGNFTSTGFVEGQGFIATYKDNITVQNPGALAFF